MSVQTKTVNTGMPNCLKDDYCLTECLLLILGEKATKKIRKFIPCEGMC